MELKGSCHCGNIHFEFKTAKSIADFASRKCECSYCTKQGSRYISDPEGELVIRIDNKENLQRYQFGTKTAEFLLCRNCGVITNAISTIDGKDYGIVNITSLELAENFGRHSKMMDYDEETLEERLDRRKTNWIGNVKVKVS